MKTISSLKYEIIQKIIIFLFEEALNIPVCKNCHNYVISKGKEFECPHCGCNETLTERTENDFKPIIPSDLQYDWKKDILDRTNVYIPSNQKEGNSKFKKVPIRLFPKAPVPVSQDVPLSSIINTIEDPSIGLDPASQKLYYQLSIEFQIILDKAPNYREGIYRWNLILPDRLQAYGLTSDAWDRISQIGDNNPKIQEQLSKLLKRIFR